jgi:hypothetical protein
LISQHAERKLIDRLRRLAASHQPLPDISQNFLEASSDWRPRCNENVCAYLGQAEDIMRRIAILASAGALATLALGACGPDDQASVGATQAAANTSLPASAVEPLVLAAPSDEQGASSPIAAAQASLAADAQQVAPVLHSAPVGTE